jgi:hypothetical protein
MQKWWQPRRLKKKKDSKLQRLNLRKNDPDI